MTNKAWCPLPWMSLNVRNNGDLRVCCNANVSKNQGLITKEDGTVYNLGKDHFDDVRNAELLKEIRKSILKEEFHSSCVRCQSETEAGMQSRAHWEERNWRHVIDEKKAKEITNEDGSIDVKINPIKYLDLRFGNLCNLKCRMCGPTDSNQWYDDTVKLWGNTYKDSGQVIKLVQNKKGKYEPEVNIYNWYENPNFWSDMESIIPTVERLYIVGGEPLLIDQHYDFLQKCVDMNRAQKIILEYNTNITNIPQRAWNIWKHFAKVNIGMSVDAVGPLNDYIRYPSNWNKIEENMRKLDVAEGDFKIWWAATIQAYNLVQLPDIMMWKIKQNFKRVNKNVSDKPIISPHPLHNPNFLNVKIFPEESKKWITNHFESEKVKAKEIIFDLDFLSDHGKQLNYTWFCNVLDHYNNYMWAKDYSNLLDKFWHYTNTLDRTRSESLKDVCPRTWELLRGPYFDFKGH